MGKTIDAPRLSGIAAEREARDSALLALSNQIGHKPSSRAADPQHLGATQGPQGSAAGANKGLSLYAAKASGGGVYSAARGFAHHISRARSPSWSIQDHTDQSYPQWYTCSATRPARLTVP
jgi:hypothetical protein